MNVLQRLNRTGILLTSLLLLGGCGIPATPVDMIKAPASASRPQRDNMSQELMRLLPDQAQLVVPMQGEQGQDISFGDLDGDGINEAVVVYEENGTSGKALKAALFKQQDNTWRIVSEIKGFGYGLEYAGFPDINHDGRMELALGWSLGAAGNGLDIYEWNNEQLELVKKKEYHGKLDLE
ncbi:MULTISPECIES: FG-GAP repeat domain-containing protein [unclassified Paenibacillus]|uniref:FG-GAP repeat domain-containing protein n=1 Tax=unclassified Paenibacillus TaxID=185978 RepID=UPI000840CCC4|nr:MULTISPECIES: VCBS repeat-containing protein [unclassified Paenibacillus]NWL89754.1 VCBS repeat-containing protein [Paenibacillus sp. 79R4]